MKIKPLLTILIILALTSCKKDDMLKNTCDVTDPTTELEWLKSTINDLEQNTSDISKYNYISQARYQYRTVFILGNCCPVCGAVIPVRDCQGEVIGILGSGEDDIDYSMLQYDVIIWKPDDFACDAK